MTTRGLKRFIGGVLEPLGVADHARRLYRLLTQPLRVLDLRAGDVRGRFWVPTAHDQEGVEYFTEGEQLDAFVRLLRPGDTVWDVGAGMGAYSILAAVRVGLSGAVYAFEPARRARRLLHVNRIVNGCRDRLRIERVGLGATATTAILVAERGAAARCMPETDGVGAASGRLLVELVSAETLLDQGLLRAPDCLKIDVEGAEHDVLAGFGPYLREGTLRAILCEIHPTLIGSFGRTVGAVRQLLESNGYSVVQAWSRGTEEHWLATRTRVPRA